MASGWGASWVTGPLLNSWQLTQEQTLLHLSQQPVPLLRQLVVLRLLLVLQQQQAVWWQQS
jgi:hypothetical protein